MSKRKSESDEARRKSLGSRLVVTMRLSPHEREALEALKRPGESLRALVCRLAGIKSKEAGK